MRTNLVNSVALKNGVRADWTRSFQMMEAISLALDAYEQTEIEKEKGYSEGLLDMINRRDISIRNAAKEISRYSDIYGILSRKINLDSFKDCIKAIISLKDAMVEILPKVY